MRSAIHCNVITPAVKELAAKVGKNVHLINNVISVWQTEMGTGSMPTLEQLNKRLSLSKDLNDEFYLAEPYAIRSKEKSRDGRLAETTTDDKGRRVIKLYPIDSIDEFFNYIYGNNDSPTAKQKQEVMKRLHKLGYTEEALRKNITSLRDVELILEWHEMSHISRQHAKGYYTPEEKADKSKVNWMAENKIQAEYEATLDALEKFSTYLKYKVNADNMKSTTVENLKKEKEERERKATENINNTISIFNNWLTTVGKRITFDATSHTYFIDGKPTDFTASTYAEAMFGAKDFGDIYRPGADIGNSVDAITRDYFLGINVYGKTYPNINEERKNTIVASLNRLKDRLDREFHGRYKVITSEIRLAGYFGEGTNRRSIGGTPDMIIIDENGDLHLLDFKAKKYEIDTVFNGEPSTDRRDYMMQLNIYKQLLESIDPSFKGKVKDLRLIWFKTNYPSINKVEYSKDAEGNITVKDKKTGETFPLAFYPEWSTPQLKENIDDSLIPLDIGKKIMKKEVPQISPIEQSTQQSSTIPIKFTESTGGYVQRTKENAAWSDITLDFTESDKGSGGNDELTKRAAGNKYIHFKLTTSGENYYDADEILDAIKKAGLPTKNIKVNIAGSEIKKLSIDQESYNKDIERILRDLQALGVTISEIRSGGQTGIDEAGIIAAQRLGIPASVHAPKGYMFRNKQGVDSSNEQAFKARFGVQAQQPTQQTPSTPTQGPISLINVQQTIQQEQQKTSREKKAVKNPALANSEESLIKVDKENPSVKLARAFTPIERALRVDYLARAFSRELTRAQNKYIKNRKKELSRTSDPKEQKEIQYKINQALDPENGRKFILEQVTPNVIFKAIQSEWKSVQGKSLEECIQDDPVYGANIKASADKILDNFFQLMCEACILIEDMESIRIIPEEVTVSDGEKGTKEISALVNKTEEEKMQEEEDDSDDEDRSKVTGNDGWSFKVRYVDPHSTTSKVIKRLLSNIAQRDRNGIVTDDIGNTRYLNSKVAYSSLLDALSSMDSPNDFAIRIKDENGEDIKDTNGNYSYTFPALENLKGRYPWVEEIIEQLNKNPNLVPAFFTAFRKDFIPYWMQYFDEDEQKWKTHFMNEPIARESTLNEVITNYEKGFFTVERAIYDIKGKIVEPNVTEAITLGEELKADLQELQPDDYELFQERLAQLINCLGFNVRESQLADFFGEFNDDGDLIKETDITKIERIIEESLNILKNVLSNEWNTNKHLVNDNRDAYETLADIIGTVSDYMQTASIRQADKTLYSYSAPNYINTLIKRLKNTDIEKVADFVENEFGVYDWFKDQKTGEWKCLWLKELLEDPEARRQLQLKELKYIGRKEYNEWSPQDINEHFILEYYSIPKNKKGTGKEYAWYNFPIFSDSPLAMFIKFRRYVDRIGVDNKGNSGQITFEQDIVNAMRGVVIQEIERIKLVQDRREKISKGEINKIANFDSKGLEFNFLPELNSYTFNEAIPQTEEQIAKKEPQQYKQISFLDKIISLKEDLEARNAAIDRAVNDIMERLSGNYIQDLKLNGSFNVIAGNLAKEGIISEAGGQEAKDRRASRAIKEYYWNQMFASSQIIELTTTDLAYYKNATDFQKRFKQVYAAGEKMFTASKYGREIEKTLYLEDYSITSNIYDNLRKVLQKAVDDHRIHKYDMDNILNKFKDITSTDGQAYRSIKSFRAVLDMMGKWDERMEKAFEAFESGNWDMGDFYTVWQTIKPFMFTNISKDDGLGGKLRVGHQNKNSEFLLLSTFGTLVSAISNSPKLKAINKFMEDNDIDVVQFESAVKVGKQGPININYSQRKLKNWLADENNKEHAKALARALGNSVNENAPTVGEKYGINNYKDFKKANDILLSQGKISQETYNERMKALEPTEKEVLSILEKHALLGKGITNPNVVHELRYEDYCVQQPTPEHIFDTTSIFGSQFRNLIIADLPEDFSLTVHGVKLNKQQVINLYQSSIINNLLDSYDNLRNELSTIEKLQQVLLVQVKTNPKYGRDMLNALELKTVKNPFTNKEEKVFNIPLNNPTIAMQMQELLLSLFKNRVTKQRIKGAACTLVSDYGLTSELKIIYNKPGDKGSGIKGIECYMPAYSKKFYEALMETDENGNQYLNIENLPEELREAVGYRIPTEDKYSMIPLIIKGFLPQQNGSSIMLPAEIVTMAGSDFDIDKLYIMLPEFKVQEYDKKRGKEDFERAFKGLNLNWLVEEETYEDKEVEEMFKEWWEKNKESYKLPSPQISKIKYNLNRALNDESYRNKLSQAQRNNLLIDLSRAILCSPEMNENLMNPGSFDNLKVVEKANRILNSSSALERFMDYLQIKPKERNTPQAKKLVLDTLDKLTKTEDLGTLNKILDKLGDRNSLTIDTFIYNHKQNMTGDALIGMYANNSSMHAKYQHTNLSVREEFRFIMDGRTINSLHDVYAKDAKGNITHRISKLAASFINASVDNVKDPVLAGLMQNSKTANITAYLIRAGVEARTIGMLFNQPIIKYLIDMTGQLSDRNLNSSIESAIKASKTKLGDKDFERMLRQQNFDYRFLMQNCMDGLMLDSLTEEQKSQYFMNQALVGMLFRDLIKPVSYDLAELTRVSRADSPNGAVAHTLGGAKMQTLRATRLLRKAKMHNSLFTLYGLNQGVLDADVNKDMSKDALRKKFMQNKMPVLQAFYSLGIDFANSTIKEYFPQVNERTDGLLNRIINNAPDTALMGESGAKIINDFYKDLTTFVLTKTKTFGTFEDSDFMSKRDFYIYEYPKMFLEAIESNPEVKNLPIIKKLSVQYGEIVFSRAGRLSSVSKELIMNSLDQLLYMDGEIEMTINGEKKTFPVQKLAEDLYMYTFFNNNLNFGPNSYNQFISSQLTSSFEEVISTLRWLDNYMTDEDYENFLDQYYANRGNEILPEILGYENGPIPAQRYTRISENEIAIKPSYVNNRNGLIIDASGVKSHGAYERIKLVDIDPATGRGGIDMYEVVESTQGNLSGEVHYIKVPYFPVKKAVYNAEMDVVDLNAALEEELEDYKDHELNTSHKSPYSFIEEAFLSGEALPSSLGEVKADSGTTKVSDTTPAPEASTKTTTTDATKADAATLASIEAYFDMEEELRRREETIRSFEKIVEINGGFEALEKGVKEIEEAQNYTIQQGMEALGEEMCGMDLDNIQI